ncbi:hypothetical protein [Prescottella agglutinans]|nr:hypothetical protein [Prescottella agglutinans]
MVSTPSDDDTSNTMPAAIVGGSALLGALVGWALMRVTYMMDRTGAPDGSADSVWGLSWTNASFPFTVVAAVVAGMSVTFAILAVLVIVSRQRALERVARERHAMAGRAPLLRPVQAVRDVRVPPERPAQRPREAPPGRRIPTEGHRASQGRRGPQRSGQHPTPVPARTHHRP